MENGPWLRSGELTGTDEWGVNEGKASCGGEAELSNEAAEARG
jgi:hypothetical protein